MLGTELHDELRQLEENKVTRVELCYPWVLNSVEIRLDWFYNHNTLIFNFWFSGKQYKIQDKFESSIRLLISKLIIQILATAQ